MVQKAGGSGWESNPPRPATRPATGFEDQETHRDLTTPGARIIEPGSECKRHSTGLIVSARRRDQALKTKDSPVRVLYSLRARTGPRQTFFALEKRRLIVSCRE